MPKRDHIFCNFVMKQLRYDHKISWLFLEISSLTIISKTITLWQIDLELWNDFRGRFGGFSKIFSNLV